MFRLENIWKKGKDVTKDTAKSAMTGALVMGTALTATSADAPKAESQLATGKTIEMSTLSPAQQFAKTLEKKKTLNIENLDGKWTISLGKDGGYTLERSEGGGKYTTKVTLNSDFSLNKNVKPIIGGQGIEATQVDWIKFITPENRGGGITSAENENKLSLPQVVESAVKDFQDSFQESNENTAVFPGSLAGE